jgi:hypothetical protein
MIQDRIGLTVGPDCISGVGTPRARLDVLCRSGERCERPVTDRRQHESSSFTSASTNLQHLLHRVPD